LCVGLATFWLAAGACVGLATAPVRGRASLVPRGRRQTWTTPSRRRRRRKREGRRRRRRTRKRSGRQPRRLLLLPHVKRPPRLPRTMVTWKCKCRRRAGSRTARRSPYIDAQRQSSTRRAMRSGMNAEAAPAVHYCRLLVARSGAIADRRRVTARDGHHSSSENDRLRRLTRYRRRVYWGVRRGRAM
jgi:hypothetical protein